MTFDMNRAWREATEMVNANREVLLIVAGLFFFLPSLAFSLFIPVPQPAAGATPEQAFALVSGFYQTNAVWLLLMSVLQTFGMLALLALLRHKTKPTVGDALKRAGTGILPYLASQILVSIGLVIALFIVVGLSAMTGSPILIGVAVIASLVALIYVFVKISLSPAVIAIEHQHNPITILKRSWTLTKGNSFRIFLFYALLTLALSIAALIFRGIVGLALALLGTSAVTIGQAVVSGLIGTIAMIYFVSILAAIHQQLAGPSAETITSTFE